MAGLRVMITGGGTGGHVYPALAVAAELERHAATPATPDARQGGQDAGGAVPGAPGRQTSAMLETGEATEIVYVGSYGMERGILARTGYTYADVHSGALRGKSPLRVLASLGALSLGLVESCRLLARFRPEVVLATGGFVCVPVVLAARLLGVPRLIYLPDVVPGWAIRTLSRVTDVVAVTSAASRRYLPWARVVETGYPTRPEIGRMERAAARSRLGLDPGTATVLVWGGSRGAQSINRAVGEFLGELLRLAQVLHISGERDFSYLEEQRLALSQNERARYALHAYLHDDFPAALAAADLVVSRAGASVLGEFPAAGLPAILVPYPYAGAHQKQNARVLVEAGAAVELEDQRLDELVAVVASLLEDRARLESMARNARAMARPDAARAIAELALSLARSRRMV